MKDVKLIADKYSRESSQNYADRHWPEIMFRKNFNYEQIKWSCPLCNVDNFVRVHVGSKLDYQPIITPRIFFCHNSKCMLRRFYWRDDNNQLFARYLGKYELINELEFVSVYDPLKFYANLNPVDIQQTNLFK